MLSRFLSSSTLDPTLLPPHICISISASLCSTSHCCVFNFTFNVAFSVSNRMSRSRNRFISAIKASCDMDDFSSRMSSSSVSFDCNRSVSSVLLPSSSPDLSLVVSGLPSPFWMSWPTGDRHRNMINECETCRDECTYVDKGVLGTYYPDGQRLTFANKSNNYEQDRVGWAIFSPSSIILIHHSLAEKKAHTMRLFIIRWHWWPE